MSKTITIQIGNSDDKLTQKEWSDYVEIVKQIVEVYALETHFFGGSSNWQPWQNVAWVIRIFSDDTMESLVRNLKEVRAEYNQDSIAWTEGETKFI